MPGSDLSSVFRSSVIREGRCRGSESEWLFRFRILGLSLLIFIRLHSKNLVGKALRALANALSSCMLAELRVTHLGDAHRVRVLCVFVFVGASVFVGLFARLFVH